LVRGGIHREKTRVTKMECRLAQCMEKKEKGLKKKILNLKGSDKGAAKRKALVQSTVQPGEGKGGRERRGAWSETT